MRDPMVQEIARNDYKVTAVWSHTNGSWDEPESDDFEIDDDEGLYETIEEIQDNNLRNAFFKGYDKYVESAEFDYDDDNYGPDPDIEYERRRDERGEMYEALIRNKASDRVNAFIYRKAFEVAQSMGVGPEASTPEEFYEAIRNDGQMIEFVAESVAPAVSAETGIPEPIAKRLVKVAIKGAARDAGKTLQRVNKQNEA